MNPCRRSSPVPAPVRRHDAEVTEDGRDANRRSRAPVAASRLPCYEPVKQFGGNRFDIRLE